MSRTTYVRSALLWRVCPVGRHSSKPLAESAVLMPSLRNLDHTMPTAEPNGNPIDIDIVQALFTIMATLLGHKFWLRHGRAAKQELTTALEHVAIVGGLLMVVARHGLLG